MWRSRASRYDTRMTVCYKISCIFRQLLALTYKNLLLRKTHYIVTAFEVLSPVLLAIIFGFIPSFGILQGGSFEVKAKYFPIYSFDDAYRRIQVNFISHDVLIGYTPISKENKAIIDQLETRLKIQEQYITVSSAGFSSESELMKNYSSAENYYSNPLQVGIIFLEHSDNKFRYVIRTRSPQIQSLYSSWYSPDFYEYRNFLWLQYNLDDIYMNIYSDKSEKETLNKTKIFIDHFPHSSYNDESYLQMIPFILTIIIQSMVLIFSLALILRIVQEKNTGMREYLRTLGLNNAVNYFAWFLNGLGIIVFVSIIITLFMSVSMFQVVPFLHNSDKFLAFLLFLCYGISLILFCLFLSIFFKKAVIAVIFSFLALEAALIISPFGLDNIINKFTYETVGYGSKMASCLLPSAALYWGLRFTVFLQLRGSDLRYDALNTALSKGDAFCLSDVFGMMAFSWIFYTVLIWYFDNVWPWQTGVPRPFYFFFLKSYWCDTRSKVLSSEIEEDKDFHEETFCDQNVGISVVNLLKIFKSGMKKKVAVDHLNLKIFENQITALLGHNGAGKTTTISIITGMYTPSSGNVCVNGYNIAKELSMARQSMGYCPQASILIPELTVEQHLTLTGQLRGVNRSKLNAEVKDIINLLNLTEKAKSKSSTLSGGMKRKLSLAMAMVGETKVLLLDEPTSGLDPEARREIWDILQTIRSGRTILLTTHYMEEADALGDRIIIMTNGKAYCSGSSMFLKNKFGAGYHLRMITQDGCNVQEVLSFVQKYVPANIERHSGRELSFLITSESTESFPDMLKSFENSLQELKIENFGLSVTNMEDVFLKVGESSNFTQNNVEHTSHVNDLLSEVITTSSFNTPTMMRSYFQRFFGLIMKRYHVNIRQPSSFILQVLLPLVIYAIMVVVLNSVKSQYLEEEGKLKMDLNVYDDTETIIKATDGRTLNVLRAILDKSDTNILKTTNILDEAMYISSNAFAKYASKYIIGVEVNNSLKNKHFTAFTNKFATHGPPISLNVVNNLKLKLVKPGSSIEVFSKPLPEEYMNSDTYVRVSMLIIPIFFPIIIAFITSYSVMFIVTEKSSKSKHLQLMTGTHPWLLWFAHYVWDFIVCFIIFLILFIIITQTSEIGSNSEISGSLFLLFFLYILSAISLVYVSSWIFNSPVFAFAINLSFNIVAALTLGVLSSALLYIPSNIESKPLDQFKDALTVLEFFPSISMTNAFVKLYKKAVVLDSCKDIYNCKSVSNHRMQQLCCMNNSSNYEPLGNEDDECGVNATKMIIGTIVFMAINLFFDFPFIKRQLMVLKGKLILMLSPPLHENTINPTIDEDVTREENEVTTLMTENGSELDNYRKTLIVNQLHKRFRKVLAVKSVSFIVPKEKCFGLLGINGAGKTTTFSMLTGDICPTSGEAYINPYTLSKNFSHFKQQIGYCPQFDALIELMTGEELLYLFARLRCVSSSKIKTFVESLIKLVNLEEHAKKKCGSYSGGNKRKLSVACAVIGSPPMLMLDEPTSGIDPVSRRLIWQLLTNLKSFGTSIVLTSHSMEECEALCDKLTIMVQGQLQCIGNITYLKSKFGRGFTLMVKVKLLRDGEDETKVQSVTDKVTKSIVSTKLISRNIGILTFHVQDPSIPWSELFCTLEEIKKELDLEDYSITATSLEQVFLSFANEFKQPNQVIIPMNVLSHPV